MFNYYFNVKNNLSQIEIIKLVKNYNYISQFHHNAESNQAHIQEKYNKMKESGQFPFFKR